MPRPLDGLEAEEPTSVWTGYPGWVPLLPCHARRSHLPCGASADVERLLNGLRPDRPGDYGGAILGSMQSTTSLRVATTPSTSP